MKKLFTNIISIVIACLAITIASCTKEMSDVRLAPAVATTQSQTITSDSATVIGFIVAQGDGFTEKGICYSTKANPTVADSKKAFTGTSKSATFPVRIGGLTFATKYYARAYGINPDGSVVYGEEMSFTTKPVVPTLTTTAISAITGSTATSGGVVTAAGGADVTARGVCFGTSPLPTIADAKTDDESGLGTFTSAIAGLKGNITYYVRAYATNSAGTGYGPAVSFKTLVDLPVVVTTEISKIAKTSAETGGNVTYDGGAPITARGVVWSTTANPTVANNKVDGGTGTGAFVSNLTTLTKATTYHVRAFATNSVGTVYGEDREFATLGDDLTWYIPGDYVAATYSDKGLANWAPDKSPFIKSSVTDPNNLEGYIYMTASANQWKFASQPNWSAPNYGDGGNGTLSTSGGNISSPAGHYKITANAADLTWKAVALNWGVIGDATAGGWSNDTPLAFNAADRTWRGVVTLDAKTFKFRAGDWAYNYGKGAAEGELKAGGDNIAVDVASDYSIVLDLNTPLAYKYEASRWGIIGDATAGGWNTDTNMSWNATKKVFTVTTNLVVGAFKFRANDGWAINYGGSLSGLTAGGDNIAIAAAGNYTITFEPWTLKATVTKN